MKHGLILIAHEDSAFIHSARTLLEEEGWRVEGYSDGAVAFSRINETRPKLVLLSLFAPAINSFEFIRTIRSSDLATTILIATAETDSEAAIAQALEAGAYDLLPSPRQAESFLAAIRRAVERQNLIDELASLRKALEGENGAIVGMSEKGVKLEAVERELLQRALARFQGNQTRAAKYLDITRRTLIYRMEKYKLRTQSVATSQAPE